jgi:dTDP-4-dehydrorhamnose reductase
MILIVGRGLIGDHLSFYLRENKIPHIISTRAENDAISIDLSKELPEKLIRQKVKELKITKAVLFAGESNPNKVFQNPTATHITNVTRTIKLLDILNSQDIKTIFISSIEVFPGVKFGYAETDHPNPLNLYGQYKLAVEEKIKLLKNCHVARTTWNIPTLDLYSKSSRCPIGLTVESLKSRKPEMAVDSFFNPILATDTAKLLETALSVDTAPKIIHLAGPNFYSRYEFAKMIYSSCDVSLQLNQPAPVEFEKIMHSRVEPRGRLAVMKSEFTEGILKYKPKPIEKTISVIASKLAKSVQ